MPNFVCFYDNVFAIRCISNSTHTHTHTHETICRQEKLNPRSTFKPGLNKLALGDIGSPNGDNVRGASLFWPPKDIIFHAWSISTAFPVKQAKTVSECGARARRTGGECKPRGVMGRRKLRFCSPPHHSVRPSLPRECMTASLFFSGNATQEINSLKLLAFSPKHPKSADSSPDILYSWQHGNKGWPQATTVKFTPEQGNEHPRFFFFFFIKNISFRWGKWGHVGSCDEMISSHEHDEIPSFPVGTVIPRNKSWKFQKVSPEFC